MKTSHSPIIGPVPSCVPDVVQPGGSLVNHVNLDDFGKATGGTSIYADFLFGLHGMAYGPLTALYETDQRRYDPLTGAWISADPSGFASNDANFYRAFANNPMVHTDPTGMFGRLVTALGNSLLTSVASTASDWWNTATTLGSSAWNTGSSWLTNSLPAAPSAQVSTNQTWDQPARSPTAGMSFWQGLLYTVTETPNQFSQRMNAQRDQRLLQGGPIAINDGYDRDRYNQLTMPIQEYEGWRANTLEANRSQPNPMLEGATRITGINKVYKSEREAVADAWVNMAEKGEYGMLLAGPGGLGETALLAAGGFARISIPPVRMQIQVPLSGPSPLGSISGIPLPFSNLAPVEALSIPPLSVQSPGKISGNPANRLVETGQPLKNGYGWVKRWTVMTAEESQAQARAISNHYEQVRQESYNLLPDQQHQFRFEQMRQFRTEYREQFLKSRKR